MYYPNNMSYPNMNMNAAYANSTAYPYTNTFNQNMNIPNSGSCQPMSFKLNCPTCSVNNNGLLMAQHGPYPNVPNVIENKFTKSKCKKCHKKKRCNSDTSTEASECEKPCAPMPIKDMCPIKSYCDPALANTCSIIPFIDPLLPPRYVTTWKINYIVSSGNAGNAQELAINIQPKSGLTTVIDPALSSPRGIVVIENQVWVTNTMSDTITNYDLFGNPQLESIQVRQNARVVTFPSGIAVNCGGGFAVPTPGSSRPATILTATKTGDVCVYNPMSDPKHTHVVLTNKEAGEVAEYTGLTIANNTLYLADFFQRHIDVFGQDYLRILGYRFVDNDSSDPIPLDFSPWNITYIAPYLYILYAKRAPGATVYHLNGPGYGFISVFNLDGSYVRRFYSRGVLNAPYDIIPAPCECGIPPGSFLVNNFGDGRINLFDFNGNHLGPLLSESGIPLIIQGITSITPYYTSFNQIYFTSTSDIENNGIMGNIVKDQVIPI